MPELLFEILSEEIPARMQQRAAADLERIAGEKLQAAGLHYEGLGSLVTPRRLTLHVAGLPERQPDVTEERKGPKEGAPEKALQGFVKGAGLSSLDEAELRDTPKGRFYFAVRHVQGRATRSVLSEVLVDVIRTLGWPKSMRWAEGEFRWVRPIQNLLAVFDGEALQGGLDLGGERRLAFTDSTVGHRFLAPDSFLVRDYEGYLDSLKQAYVVPDFDERRKSIVEQCSALAHAAGLAVRPDSGLIDEVTGLVEWPCVLIGRIAPELMTLPPEVLITSMRSHQRYFSLMRHDGGLADRFLVVANLEAPAESELAATIVTGNERVLRARLADAAFFWDQDRVQRLDTRIPALRPMVFHAKLGSLEEKVLRVAVLARGLAAHLDTDTALADRAAMLAKADLTTGMVGEFPELQGVMGRYYAANDGEAEEVAAAIAEHYAPLGPNDACPSAPVSVAVALADKLDTLAGFWAIGETPTGSKDPYALRRAALGVIRLIVENGLRLPLGRVLAEAVAPILNEMKLREQLASIEALDRLVHEGRSGQRLVELETNLLKNLDIAEVDEGRIVFVVNALLAFFADRMKVVLREKGVRHDLVSAVFNLGGEDDLVRLLARVDALAGFLESEEGANLLIAYRRAANIVRIEAKKEGRDYCGPADASALVETEEKALHAALQTAEAQARDALAREDFTAVMAELARLRAPVDGFFDRVTVNAEDPGLRVNRLALLAQIGGTLGQVADFSAIEG
ncbi:glycine--tRNA ligase subunit beta [Aquibaculum sediminis]|uniref:glycine--tRNA ligase subunit beta n=1 Tax=Aquibaculum sediminis TaxID=3231907 RepID=UPI0034562406